MQPKRSTLFRFIVTFLGLWALLACRTEARANESYDFDFNDRCQQAYQLLLAFRMGEANALIQEELKERPGNLVPVMLANYDDCLRLLFNGDPLEYDRLKPNMDRRLERLKQGNQASPWYKFSLAQLYFQWASVRIRFNEYFSAGTEFRKSFLLLKDNKKKFPDFKYNLVLLGLEEAIVGTVPDNYKWIASMLGMKGDVKKGIDQIARFLNTKDGSTALLREEAAFYYAYLRFNLLADKKGAWKFLENSGLDVKGSRLFTFMNVNFALNDNQALLAENLLQNREQRYDYVELPIFDYLMGIALLQKTDERCLGYFQKFLNNYKGNLFVKDAYQKMSLFYQSSGQTAQARLFKNKIKNAGNAQIDADKQAQRYATATVPMPHPGILKIRLLSDGGYYSKALDLLGKYNASDFPNKGDLLEYYYRQARVYALLGLKEKSFPFYEETIRLGQNRQEHFAARSALELGQIYEDSGQPDKAIREYKRCLAMKNHDYKSSLDQKAKAGLNRLGAAR